MANTYHQLGVLAQDRGDYNTTRKLYEQSLHIKEELGDRAGIFDLSLVRFLFIIFTVVNFGLGILIYILLAMVMPYKEDIEEEMYGTGPRKRKEAEAIEDDKDGWFW